MLPVRLWTTTVLQPSEPAKQQLTDRGWLQMSGGSADAHTHRLRASVAEGESLGAMQGGGFSGHRLAIRTVGRV